MYHVTVSIFSTLHSYVVCFCVRLWGLDRLKRRPRLSVWLCEGGFCILTHLCLCVLQVLGCLVWALIADTYYQPYPSYGWVMFVAVFFWMVTLILFVMYLFQLQLNLYMIPWPLVVSTQSWGDWPFTSGR